MKNIFAFGLLLMLALTSSGADASDTSAWQGTWVKGTASTLTLRNCRDSRCEYMLRTAPKVDAGCSQAGQAELKGATAKLTPSGGLWRAPFTPNSYGCTVDADLKDGAVSLKPFTKVCQYYCLTGSPSAEYFKRLSEQPYADDAKCVTDKSRARQIWCVTQDFETREKTLSDLAMKAEAADATALKGIDNQFPDTAIKACETSDPLNCLKQKYDEREKLLLSLSTNATAAHEKRSQDLKTAGDPAKAAATIEKIAGVYKEQFQNGMVSGEEYKSENVLEIVRVSDTSIYFKTHLDFFNGHECNAFGLAKYSTLNVFFSQKENCKITISTDGKEIRFDDEGGTCKDQCGARGSLSNVTFPLKKKRPIKYMDRLKKSGDYLKSIAP